MCHSDTSGVDAAQVTRFTLHRTSAHEIVQVHEADDPPFVFQHRERHHPVLLHYACGDGSELVRLGGPGRPRHHVGDWNGQEIFFALHESGEIA